MSELKSYINRVLGNSLRCLLPSYWWKRLFGLIVDELEDINDRIDAIGSGSDDDGNVITIYMPHNTEKNRLANIDAYNAIVAALRGGQTIAVQNLESLPSHILSYTASAIVLVNDKVMYQVSLTGDNGNDIGVSSRELHADGTVEILGSVHVYEADAELSTTSEKPVQNKVVADRFELLAPIMFLPVSGTEEAKAMNAEAYRQYIETTGYNRRVAIYSLLGGGTINVLSSMGPMSNAPQSQYITLIWYDFGGGIRETRVYSDGSVTDVEIESDAVEVDTELSEESSNAIANKTVTEALKNKVEKVDGKQLSTEDFTSLLKAKLEGLSNYDDSSIKNAINSLTTQINTLVSGDASVAIESFNEIIAFLNGIEDSENLDSIIAAIEQQIAGKQNTIYDLADIRAGAAKGATALQSVPAGYVTSALLEQEITNVENQITGVVTTIPQRTSQLNNDSGFTTEEYVNAQVRNAIISALNTEV